MPLITYKVKRPKPETLAQIKQANEIIAVYREQGMTLTLRQLYYQFVSRDLIANNDKEYDKLGKTISTGRLAGMIDWDAIVDRMREVKRQPHWDRPSEILDTCAEQFRIDKWDRQPTYLEVFIEKDALIGVIETVCKANDVPYLACRGYASISELWNAGHNRFRPRLEADKRCVVLYLGDHDPSGMDMPNDVEERLNMFAGDTTCRIEVKRIALNMDQIELYNPPPNPAKMTDSRAKEYVRVHGQRSWELDALDPLVIRDLIQHHIEAERDDELWDEAVEEEQRHRRHLAMAARNWDTVIEHLPIWDADRPEEPDLFEDV